MEYERGRRSLEGPVAFTKGDVVVFHFPFTDSQLSKRRPSVVAAVSGENLILCQITSQARPDPDIIALQTRDFKKGLLKMDSYIRPAIIFTIHRSKIEYIVGEITEEKITEVERKLCEIFTR